MARPNKLLCRVQAFVEANNGVRSADVATAFGINVAYSTTMLSVLKGKGLVTSEPDPAFPNRHIYYSARVETGWKVTSADAPTTGYYSYVG